MSLDARPGENGPHIDSPHLHQSQQVTTVSGRSTRQKDDRRTQSNGCRGLFDSHDQDLSGFT
ncbi:hypothetical protein MJO28_000780 [Puccinia striiformis f. sp. tritici]|uniref:Uncharacterized protein n=2 Tax=Puccinia striiformis TaxID=27350 RepID=A0A2S4WAY9_9BASI|nr:hypothetical protein Pst134EA_000460 [Puccinia striiformis f. sp. tritici]KAH9473386.1 hypothetical protein Pst134EA_000460 [Puccinia striiformis f. sp. tritici]KAI7962686.1 hypothetical protein MJO28_000780 [Puccinia striiformis f. sp. tritici]POW18935.1 hypothetical protein PSHT_05260 [Puccinia striiformis]